MREKWVSDESPKDTFALMAKNGVAGIYCNHAEGHPVSARGCVLNREPVKREAHAVPQGRRWESVTCAVKPS